MGGQVQSEEFTERSYARLVETAANRYRFEPFGTTTTDKHVLWRHDVDLSVHRAVALALIERDVGVKATYFLWPHSEFYNLWERTIVGKVQEIKACGHWIGLHFDAGFYPDLPNIEALEEKILYERAFVENVVGTPITCFSFHDPDTRGMLAYDRDDIAGMVNAYGRGIRESYKYVSDSNGYWRFDNLYEVVEEAVHERLHVLTHPGWWNAEPLSPRERVERCVKGRAKATMNWYDEALKAAGRTNVR